MTTPSWYEQVKAVFDARGVPEQVWFPILYAESGGNPNALADTRGKQTAPGTQPEYSVGLFQINLLSRGVPADQLEAERARLSDPVANAQAAVGSIASAWDAVKSVVSGSASSLWAGIVATRSGHPGGHPTAPCTSTHCQNAATRISNIAQQFIQSGIAGFSLVAGGAATQSAGAVGSAVSGAVTSTTGALGDIKDTLSKILGPVTEPDFWPRFIVFLIGLGLVFISVAATLFPGAVKVAYKGVKTYNTLKGYK